MPTPGNIPAMVPAITPNNKYSITSLGIDR